MLTTLSGLKVLDFGIYFAGPYSSRLLADLGAEVVKLEAPAGDLLRPTTKPFNGAQRGKRSIAVDLKTSEGRSVAHRLVAWADVVTHNLRPGVAERLDMGYERLRQLNPTIVYAYAPGWGSSGPDSARPGFAPLFSAYAGLHYEAAGAGNVPVAPMGNEDNGNGLVGAGAILMALLRRRRTGESVYLEHPQLNATLLMALHLMRRDDGSVTGSIGLDGERLGVHPLDRLYATADGWLCLWARTPPAYDRLAAMPEFAAAGVDPTTVPSTADELAMLQDALAGVLATASTDTWVERLGAAGVACEAPAGPGAPRELLHDAEQERLGRVEVYRHPRWGEVRDIAVLLRMSAAGTRPGRPAPEIGQHTNEILHELGCSDDEIASLHDAGAVRSTTER